jgi:hypothetical protein
VSGISVGVWSGLTTLTWVRTIWLAFGCVLLWMMGLCEQACSCCLSFRPQSLTSSCEMRFSYLCTRSLVALILSLLGGLAFWCVAVSPPGLLHPHSLASFHGFLGRHWIRYHPREHLPPPGQVLLVPFFLHWLSYGSLCYYVLSLDRRPASIGASLLPALALPFVFAVWWIRRRTSGLTLSPPCGSRPGWLVVCL